MAVGDLHAAADELLIAASEACALAPGGAMSRVYVSPGVPPWDCPDQLTVHVGPAIAVAETLPLQPPLQPMHRVGEGRHLNLVTMTVTALRCVNVMLPDQGRLILPDPAALEADAVVINGDVWAIWNHLATRKRNLTLFPPKVREFAFDPALPVITEGAIGGWQVQCRVQVDGYAT